MNRKRKSHINNSLNVPVWASEVDSWIRGPRRNNPQNESLVAALIPEVMVPDVRAPLKSPQAKRIRRISSEITFADSDAKDTDNERARSNSNNVAVSKKPSKNSTPSLWQTVKSERDHEEIVRKTEEQRTVLALLKRRNLLEQLKLELLESSQTRMASKFTRLLAKSVYKKPEQSLSTQQQQLQKETGCTQENRFLKTVNERPEFRANAGNLCRPDSFFHPTTSKNPEQSSSSESKSHSNKVNQYLATSKKLFGNLSSTF